MATEIECMQPHELAQSLKASQFEQVYHRSLRDTERIYEEERARILRVQVLLLEDENEELQYKIDQDDSAIEQLEDSNDEMRSRLSEAEAELQHTQTELKTRLRDIERYKAEIEAHNNSNSEATRILSEKLALARELATLKPELEHLKSQTSSQQNLLADKLSLQRELSSAQVELENEKRTVQRLQSQRQASNHDDSALHTEIDDLKKEVGKMQKEIQKHQRESIKKQSEWESQKEVLESKLDAFRTKLRTTKEQLKDAQDELEKSQAAKMAQSAELTKARLAGKMAPPPVTGAINPRKRNIARFDPDMTIGTPGQGGPVAKKQRISVSIGDKSTFSMTPFLNRTTMSILPETPSEEVAEAAEKDENEANPEGEMRKQMDSIIEEAEVEAAQKKAVKEARERVKASQATKNPPVTITKSKSTSRALKESTTTKANKALQKPSLGKVMEEGSIEHEPAKEMNAAPSPPKFTAPGRSNFSDQENKAPSDHEQSLKKQREPKRKRPNIFDDEDEAMPIEPKTKKAKTLKVLGKAGGIGGLGNVSLLAGGGGGGGGAAAATTSKARKTFAEFSPLKKDRRAAAPSGVA